MEVIFSERFPHLNELIFSELDNKSLVTCKEVDETWNKFIEGKKLPWIRMIEKQIGRLEQFPETWKKVTSNTQVKNVQELALTVDKFYNFHNCDGDGYYDVPNAQTEWTPIHIIASIGRLDLCQSIFEKVLEKNPPSNYGITPLHMAAAKGHLDVYNLIMGCVNDKNPLDNEGETPLHIAAYEGHFEVCKLIIAHVDEKNPADNIGDTPLHNATLKGHLEVCKLFLTNVCYKSPANNDGDTPLHAAALKGHLEICKLFLENVCNKSPADNDGDTPLP